MTEDDRYGLPIPWPEDAPYTASYCEENVYLLVARYMAMTHVQIHVVFVSNPNKTVSPTWASLVVSYQLSSACTFGHAR